MFKISKQFEFSAAHQLSGLPDDHPCARLHGHNYIVVVELESASLNEVGFVRDYGELSAVKEYLDKTHDHRNLNDLYDQPTAENIAKRLFHVFHRAFPELVAVRVSETPKTWAEYCPEVGEL